MKVKELYTNIIMLSMAYLAISGLLLASYGYDNARPAILMVAVIVWLMSLYPLVNIIKVLL